MTVQNSQFNHNGSMVISGKRNRNLVLENDQNSFNNGRGAYGGMKLWENGMKLSSTDGARISNFAAIENQAPGLWLDTDNRNVTIENAIIERNVVDGILLEANQGPITLTNNTVCGNGRAGICDGRANEVSPLGNRSYANGTAQLQFSGDPLARSVTDWQTGVTVLVRSEGWTIRGNTFAASSPNEMLVGGWGVTPSAWATMTRTMHSQSNSWFHDASAAPCLIPGSGVLGDTGAWIAASGETGSSFSTGPSALSCETASGGGAVSVPAPAAAVPPRHRRRRTRLQFR